MSWIKNLEDEIAYLSEHVGHLTEHEQQRLLDIAKAHIRTAKRTRVISASHMLSEEQTRHVKALGLEEDYFAEVELRAEIASNVAKLLRVEKHRDTTLARTILRGRLEVLLSEEQLKEQA